MMLINRPPYETNGQYLARYLLTDYVGGNDYRWIELKEALPESELRDDWVEAFKEMVSLQLTRRLISAGQGIARRQKADDPTEKITIARKDILEMIAETMQAQWTPDVSRIYSKLEPAVRSAMSSISHHDRREVKNEAKRRRPYCYLCGNEMYFDEENHERAFTIDHVWPRAYGGNSDVDNLLGACKSCNEAKKDTPSWAMYPIQSLSAGFNVQDRSEIPKVLRFAVQARTAKERAKCKGLSLRDAYLDLGQPDLPLVRHPAIAIDFFNLRFAPQMR